MLQAQAAVPPAGPLDPQSSREAARLAAQITEASEEDLRRRTRRRLGDLEEENELEMALQRSRIDK